MTNSIQLKEAASNKITKEEIQLLPLIEFTGTIILVQDKEHLNQVLETLEKEEHLGLDTEKRPTFTKGQSYPVSLLQLATDTHAYIIQLRKTGFPTRLKKFLANETIKKLGIALHDDMKELQKLGHFKPGGLVHLDQLARHKGLQQTGARSLTAIFLQRRLSKSCQKSNWANLNLSKKQQIYAATDAWICVQLYPFLHP